ncbi:transmembrane protein, putative [Bodo saltans]|uniref:Transmembrane protein, putative n=1 Tax=Bodo saltans TaxID=75058 RepID=A0A0S4JPF7_BODSA|nr:transmembrane protein, putative [Bodo saltans]|eukprot:CUG92358.1 transmembrane protein, putative [Bodo saltans]
MIAEGREGTELTEIFSTPHADDYSRYVAEYSDDEAESPKQVATSSEGVRAELIDIGDARKRAQVRRDAKEIMLTEMRDLLLSVNIFGGKLPAVSRLFCLFVILSCLCAVGAASFMIYDQVSSDRFGTVSDGSVCEGTTFYQGKFSSVNYNITVFIINAFFCVWFAVRGVNLEKTGNLVCMLAAAAFQIGRVLYFCFGGTLDRSFPSGLGEPLLGVLVASVVFLVFGALCTRAVYKEFGWITYAKGLTQATQLDQLHKYNRFDTAVKLDTFVSINGLISVLFLVESVDVRIVGTIVIAFTVVLLLFFKLMIKRRQTWFVVLTIVVGLLSPAFYFYALVFLIQENDNVCYNSELLPCFSSERCSSINPDALGCQGGWNYNLSLGFESSGSPRDTFLPTNSSSQEGFLLNSCTSSCAFYFRGTILSFIDQCCDQYGICVVQKELQDHDRALMIAIALCAVVIRIVSLTLGYLRRREMEIPSVKEMFERAERNLAELRSAAAELRRRGIQ